MTQLRPIDLHCNHRQDPLGIDVPTPSLGWALDGGGRHAVQSAYRVTVRQADQVVWDSGKVVSDAQMHIRYAGAALQDRTRYVWQVQVWDGQQHEGPWSQKASFETAYLDPANFPGAWIGVHAQGEAERHPLATATWLRPSAPTGTPLAACGLRFTIPAHLQVRAAVLHCLAEGHDQPWTCGVFGFLSVNGTRPDSCSNQTRLAVMTYDIGRWLKAGENHVAMRFFLQPEAAFIGRVVVELSDGTSLSFSTGEAGWRLRPCPQRHPDPEWDDAKAEVWAEGVAVGGFGHGPWPADDKRNRCDRLIPAAVLRRVFTVRKPVARARIYATAGGAYELTLGGTPIGDRVLAPGWTDFRHRVHYQTYDVTQQVLTGENELGATIGDGWWSGHLATPFGCSFYGFEKSLKLALHLEFGDGTSEVIATDPGTWQGRTGAVRLADLMEGQDIDFSREPGPWRAAELIPGPSGRLQAQPDEPVRRLLTLPVRSLTEKRPGVYVLDFGQNLVGWIRLQLRAPRGTRITARHTEVLDLQGEVWTDNLRSALAIDHFICSGGDDVFEPSLTFHGFRYVELSGLPGGLRPEQVLGVVVGSDTADRGTFTCDQPLLNRLQANIRWGQRGNFLSIPTDCPQRDERLGWTADTQVFARTAVHNADCAAFYAKYVDDLLDAQHPDGGFPHFAPTDAMSDVGVFGWADAGVVMPWSLWRLYGDLTTAAKAFPGVRRYLDARDRRAKDDLDTAWSFGDWVSPAPQTPNEVLGPIFHAWMHRLAAELGAALGRSQDAEHHRTRFARIRSAWRAANLAADGRCQTSDTQAAYACGLRAGVLEPGETAAHFVRSVERHGWHLNTGFLGTYCLLPALNQIGREDVAWRILLQQTAPGWLYTVVNGATTMWERWNSYTPETGPVNVGNMNSYNHYAFGAVGEWMYSTIAGIERAEDDVAFQRLVIRPVPSGSCRHARGEYRSLRGTIRSSWWYEQETFRLEVEIPPNCTAEVHLPARPGAMIQAEGARHLHGATYAVGGGRWSFTLGS